MPPHRQTKLIHTSNSHVRGLSQLAQRHGGYLPHHHNRHRPYVTPPHTVFPRSSLVLPHDLVDKIVNTQDAAVNKTTQVKDASCLHEFLRFCEGLGISNSDALPAKEDLLIAWAASYAGQLAGKTVGAKLLAIRKEHKRRGLVWQGGALLRRILKGVEEFGPASLFRSKRAPITIEMLEDLNRGLSRTSGLDICIWATSLLLFFCQLRSGEILPPKQDLNKFNPHRHPTFSNIAVSTADSGVCNLHLPCGHMC